MTAVPPPVPPEIVEKAAKTLHVGRSGCECGAADGYDREPAQLVLAAVYGDIVEAARRDALDQAVDAIKAKGGDSHARAARIVDGLRDSEATT